MSADPENTIDGAAPAAVARPETAGDLAAELVRAGKAGLRVLPAGCGSRMGTGAPVASSGPSRLGLLLVTTALSRVLEYEPADLTVTVEAGCDVRALDAVLGERGQFLPLQGRRRAGTIGGLLATAPEGALALVHGQPRDSLTGLRAALADGSLIKAGGRVVKNVAGFPIHRLMTGSFGTLGVIVEASFKVQPWPEARGTALIAFASAPQAFEAARSLLESGMEPVFVNVLLGKVAVRPLPAGEPGEGDSTKPAAGSEAWAAGAVLAPAELDGRRPGATLLAVGFDGLESRVKAHLRAIPALVAPGKPMGVRLLEGDEQQRLRDAPGRSRWRRFAGIAERGRPARRRPLTGSGSGRAFRPCRDIPKGRHPRDSAAVPDRGIRAGHARRRLPRGRLGAGGCQAGPRIVLRDDSSARTAGTLAGAIGDALAAARSRGRAVLHSAPLDLRRALDTWGPPPPDFPLMRRIKEALDPGGLFVAGRFVGGL